MYYFLPKAAGRPVYSYRLSLVHFWSLIFIYIWAGPHHLLYSSLPDWAQTLGVVFSVMLIAPSWGGMLNGLLTLRGAWDKVRQEPVLKFMVVALTGYGMATFEGPMLSLKTVNGLAHFTDWIPAHVHVGTLGWNGFFTFAMMYWLVPKLFGRTEVFSRKLMNLHFWIGVLGIVFWVVPMYFSGFTQGLMWKEFTEEGFLRYPNFLETLIQIVPMHQIRAVGGTLYFVGLLIMVYNLYMTATSGKLIANEYEEHPPLPTTIHDGKYAWHRVLERKPMIFVGLTTFVILIGGIVELVPTFLIKSNVPTIAGVKPYTPLELEGRDIYIREGCIACHTQLVRPFRSETERYGEYSKSGEYVYDHPFLWGSKRTGPDLKRLGQKYSDSWHYHHMLDPRTMSPGSIMPPYPWLHEKELDMSLTASKVLAMRQLGVPYPEGFEKRAVEVAQKQQKKIAENLKKDGIQTNPNTEIVALIAYLQRLGVDIKNIRQKEQQAVSVTN
jgi:cytochrome c oxidase cbb3-type subunit I/II